MEYPIGTLMLSNEVEQGDLIANKAAFERGYILFFEATGVDVTTIKKDPNREVVKLIYDSPASRAKVEKLEAVKDVPTGSIILYNNKRYKTTMGKWNSSFHDEYLGEKEDAVTIVTIIPEDDKLSFVYKNNQVTWMNHNTLVKVVI